MVVGNGKRTYLWEDARCGLVSLRDKSPYLYCICSEQEQVCYAGNRANQNQALIFGKWLDQVLIFMKRIMKAK
jgi:hypothetical protein